MIETISKLLNQLNIQIDILPIIKAIGLLLIGYILSKLFKRAINKYVSSRLPSPQDVLMSKIAFYVLFFLFISWALKELGFSISVLLGAAGFVTIAFGFAAQTSVSNIISGIFLMLERPFAIGDVIRINGTAGTILSIDLLSLKLKTFDNLFIRVPNETILKNQVINVSRFPIRRIDLPVSIAYKEDLTRVQDLLMKLADSHDIFLKEPEPVFIFKDYGESSINIQFSVWIIKEDFLKGKNFLAAEIKKTFNENNVEIPFPHRSIGLMSQESSIPVELKK